MTTISTVFVSILADGAAATGAAGTPATAPAGSSPFGGNGFFLPMILIMGVWIFFSFNSKRKQDKQRQALLNSMKRGDRVQTLGGVLGTIVEVRDSEIVIKVDESNNTKIKFVRSAIQRVIGEEEKAEAK